MKFISSTQKPYKDRKPQTKSSKRNFNKARLMGFTLDVDVITKDEYEIVKLIRQNIKDLLIFWDLETEKLIGHELKPFKCASCGRRSTVSHTHNDKQFCLKHYKMYTSND